MNEESPQDNETITLDEELSNQTVDANLSSTKVLPAIATEKIKTWPISILFIVGNEFCERL